MYFDKIIQTLKDFDAVETAAAEAFKEAQKKLTEDYGNTGRVFVDEYAKAKALYEATVAEAKQNSKAIVEEEFEKIHGIVRDFVTSPVPSDFPSTLEAIKTAGANLTSAEIEVYTEKYKKNYMAYLGLTAAISAAKGQNFYFKRYDAIKTEIEEYYTMTMKIFDQYGRGGYMRAVLISDKHTPLSALDVTLQKFLHEDVAAFKDPEQEAMEEDIAAGLATLNK